MYIKTCKLLGKQVQVIAVRHFSLILFVKSIFARKKRPWQIHQMLRCIRIKHNMKGSRVKRRMKLKGYEVRGVFPKVEKAGRKKKEKNA